MTPFVCPFGKRRPSGYEGRLVTKAVWLQRPSGYETVVWLRRPSGYEGRLVTKAVCFESPFVNPFVDPL